MGIVENSITFSENMSLDDIVEVLYYIKGKDNNLVDFSNITPIPEWVYGSKYEHFGGKEYLVLTDELLEIIGIENTINHWCEENWGTTNAFDAEYVIESKTLTFNTYTNNANYIFSKLRYIFPNLAYKFKSVSDLHGIIEHFVEPVYKVDKVKKDDTNKAM